MKEKIHLRVGGKQKIILVLAMVSAVLFAFLYIVSSVIRGIPDSQQAAVRWSTEGDYTQISVFYTEEASPEVERLSQFEETLEETYAEDGIKAEENARLWISAASGSGSVQIVSDRALVNVTAVGVHGDFFQFHPQKLLYGSLPSGDSKNTNWIVIDEEIAWQLFGSSDVAGMEVSIGGVPHYISGVIKRQCDVMEEKAGADEATVYLPYESLSTYGHTSGIICYEILLPDPVSGYGKKLVEDRLGGGGDQSEVMENGKRYSLMSLMSVVKNFGTRSMKRTEIVYPTWENAARGWEDVLAVIMLWQIVCVAVLLVVITMSCVSMYRMISRKMRLIREKD